mmetsp:Transcript_17825/g.53765  ORF Transcript_17825/g.53765 Transcript_17825/m.53765 type:complete len:270 (-) Transcript_17825:573-1382(-)
MPPRAPHGEAKGFWCVVVDEEFAVVETHVFGKVNRRDLLAYRCDELLREQRLYVLHGLLPPYADHFQVLEHHDKVAFGSCRHCAAGGVGLRHAASPLVQCTRLLCQQAIYILRREEGAARDRHACQHLWRRCDCGCRCRAVLGCAATGSRRPPAAVRAHEWQHGEHAGFFLLHDGEVELAARVWLHRQQTHQVLVGGACPLFHLLIVLAGLVDLRVPARRLALRGASVNPETRRTGTHRQLPQEPADLRLLLDGGHPGLRPWRHLRGRL